MHSLVSKVSQYIQSNHLFQMEDKIILACSGGSDSMALLHVLHSLNYKLIIAHANFTLRGTESVREEEFVKVSAAKLNLPYYSKRFDTQSYAMEHGISIEMAARDLRYDWFQALSQETQATKIATAHHLKDSAETTILNIIKGTGLRGMRGIPAVNGNIVRPFSEISKGEIENYLNNHSIQFCIDSSNLENDYLRNKIRNQILPIVEEINPNFQAGFRDFQKRNRDIQDLVDCFIKEHFETDLKTSNAISIDALAKYSFAEYILFELLRPFGFNASCIADVFKSIDGQSGKQFFSDTHVLIRDRAYFLIQEKTDDQHSMSIQIDKDEIGCEISIGSRSLRFSFCDEMGQASAHIAYMDCDKIAWPLRLRKIQPGDVFQPFGMEGKSKKIQDYCTDNKYTLFEKRNLWVMEDSKAKICWLVGKRLDHRLRIDSETKHILRVELVDAID